MKQKLFLPLSLSILLSSCLANQLDSIPLGLISTANPETNNSEMKDDNNVFSNQDIKVTFPMIDTLVRSPLIVTGEAKGSWYWESYFDVYLYDANKKELAHVQAQSVGDWMNEKFVPFRALLNFSQPETENGSLVLEKANPSGKIENKKRIEIRVRLK